MLKKLLREIRDNYLKQKRNKILEDVRKADYQYGLNDRPRDIPRVVVSMASYPARFNTIDLTLKSLLIQTMKPDKIIVWLGCDTQDSEIEDKLAQYRQYGVEFRKDNENDYKSHKKYMYAFKEYGDSIIITVDDDLIYPRDMISSLVSKYKKNKDVIIARRVHKIVLDGEKIAPYSKWRVEYLLEHKPSHYLCATTGGGTLFPPAILPEYAYDYNLIKSLSPTADDIWLKFVELSSGVKVQWAGNILQLPPSVNDNQDEALKYLNVGMNKNDEYVKKLSEYFNITNKNFL